MTRSRVGSRYPMRTAMIRVSRYGVCRTIASADAAGSASGDLVDFRGPVAEFAEQIRRVFAEPRRRQSDLARRLRKADRNRSRHDRPLARMLDLLEESG